MKRSIAIIFLLALAWGQVDKVGSTTAQFLKLGVGSRAQGMGGSFVALANDGSGPYWNPAGILAAENVSASFHHLDWVLDIRKDYVSILAPLNRGTSLALTLSALSMDEKPVTTVQQPEGTGLTYGVLDLALGISLARRVSDRLGYGITMKTIQLSAYNESASGFAFDIGSILRTDFHDLTIGMALTNFGGDLKYEGRDLLAKADIDESIDGNYTSDVNLKTESWPLPLRIQIGIAVDLWGSGNAFFQSRNSRLTLAVDAVHPNDGPEHLNAGLEWGWNDWLFLRGGTRFNYDQEQWTLGGGLIWSSGGAGRWSLNYSVAPLGVFGATTQVSLEWIIR